MRFLGRDIKLVVEAQKLTVPDKLKMNVWKCFLKKPDLFYFNEN